MKGNKYWSWTLVIFWMGVIFIFSHQPASVSSEMSGGLIETIRHMVEVLIPVSDRWGDVLHTVIRKLAHFTIYMILGVFLYKALMLSSKIPHIKYFQLGKTALIIGMFYAMTDEIHQLFIIGRSGEYRDVLIDSLGVLAGALFYYKIKIRKTLHRY